MEKTATQWMITPLQKYATFSGRARRAEYWWFYVLTILFTLPFFFVAGAAGNNSIVGGGMFILYFLLSLGISIPSLAVLVRRLHDTDKSGWLMLVTLIPLIGGILLLVWVCSRGTVGENRFGPDPLAGDGASNTL